MKNSDLFDAQALGQLDTIKPANQAYNDTSDHKIPEVIDSPSDLNMALGRAKHLSKTKGEVPYLVVSNRLLQHITGDPKELSITYHGVRIYQAGSKETLDYEESMNAEFFHDRMVKKKQASLPK